MGIAVLIVLVVAREPISTPESWWIVLLLLALVVAGVEALRRTSLAMDELPATTDIDA